ncbi:MAG TPA: UDP-N-acetylmuramoyl-L-alanyl-D-glutamate--2,6-diaminopimelate ligase [Planctomycetota bacterium]|nr:UDP-N-acetylmuramoyl-L-alanyl-D-glutamate--2,6-diaminopimelate ligase [Planctomycetota bacterium]
MHLSHIARGLARGATRFGTGDPEVTGIAIHSKRVRSGDLFVAIPGTREDGGEYVEEALRRGAVALLAERAPNVARVPGILVESARAAAAEAAAIVFGEPARDMTIVGVTGTNGKTTTASLVRWMLERGERPCALLGTTGYSLAGREVPAANTTPDAVTLQSYFRELVDAGVRSCAMEVSSHALDQERVRGVRFAVGVFTNLSGEHLDYHKDLASYLAAKKKLFDALDASATAVGNADDSSTRVALSSTRARRVLFGLLGEDHPSGVPSVTAEILRSDLDGVDFVLRAPGVEVKVASPLLGAHNVSNALAAAAAALAVGVSVEAVVSGIERIGLVRGRLERVDDGRPFRVFVDYAHTDDALAHVLRTLRPLTRGRLTVVFGCGGDRDRTKRPRMGAVARELADRVIVTSDNPRSESPMAIASSILEGAGGTGPRVRVELDRRRAIRFAVTDAKAGDVILIAGKGHETYQIVGDATLPFDDREVAREALHGAV